MLRTALILSALSAALPAAAQEAPPPVTGAAPAPATALAEIVLMEAPPAPDPATYAAAITSALNAWAEAQQQLLEEQRAELDERRALLEQESALLEQQRALAERQAEIMPPDEITIPAFFHDARPDTFKPGVDGRDFRPGPDFDRFSPGPVDTETEFFTTDDPPDPP